MSLLPAHCSRGPPLHTFIFVPLAPCLFNNVLSDLSSLFLFLMSFRFNRSKLVMPGDNAFGEWAEDAKLHGIENLEKFRKAGKYRLHLDKTGMRGSEVLKLLLVLL